jgi:FkbM family methyltransferase
MSSYFNCLNQIEFDTDYNPTFFDVGCNINPIPSHCGVLDDFTELFLKLYPNARGYGVDPIHWQSYEKKWCANENVSIIKKALSDKNSVQNFYVPQAHALSSLIDREVFHTWGEDKLLQKVEVECVTLDSLVNEFEIDTIDYLKLDTEGGELLILKGSQNLLNNGKINLIQMEWGCWSDINMSIEKMDEYLSQYNYSNIYQNSWEVLYALN